MKRNKLLELIGFRYIVNHKSKEIHKISSLHKNCHVVVLNGKYATKFWVIRLLNKGYNGCRWCNKIFDNG